MTTLVVKLVGSESDNGSPRQQRAPGSSTCATDSDSFRCEKARDSLDRSTTKNAASQSKRVILDAAQDSQFRPSKDESEGMYEKVSNAVAFIMLLICL